VTTAILIPRALQDHGIIRGRQADIARVHGIDARATKQINRRAG
jgi:hypothetical protein